MTAGRPTVLFDVDGALVDSNAVTTSDDVQRSKPDPSIFLTAMHRNGGDPASTIVVGDSTGDIVAATGARLPCVAVESGGFSESELAAAGAIAVFRDVEAVRLTLRSGPLTALLRI